MNLLEKINNLFGYTYVVNFNTLEIHNLKNKHKNCKIDFMTNKKLITKKQLMSYLDNGFNGCKWCFKEFNVE